MFCTLAVLCSLTKRNRKSMILIIFHRFTLKIIFFMLISRDILPISANDIYRIRPYVYFFSLEFQMVFLRAIVRKMEVRNYYIRIYIVIHGQK